MKNKRVHKLISMILAATLLCALLPLYASAAKTTYSGKALAAVSTSLLTGSRTNGYFSSVSDAESDAEAMKMLFTESDRMDGIIDIKIDPETGETLYIKDKDLPKVEEVPVSESPDRQNDIQKVTQQYKINDEKVIYEKDNLPHTMVCRYIGKHCTVWGCKSDGEKYSEKLLLTEAQAEIIGDAYDGYYQDIVTAYGNWYDADGDGKLAIFCFDIEQDYQATSGTAFSGKYTAGYFWSVMLADSNGSVNNGKVNYSPTSKYKDCYASTDCICMDTFPAMGSSKNNPLNKVGDDLSTLVHENQHLINFSYRVLGSQRVSSDMETFMNEAFSMAAEHMICGENSTSDRVNYFNNSSDYVTGYPLTYWDNTDVLSNYSNSYLFGQYLRTRYAALKDDPEDPKGNTFYKTLLQQWQSGGGSTSAISIAASIFGTTPKQLVIDFWAAIYLKNPTGWYGFQGESWADRINPLMSTSLQKKSIGNGGVRYYDLSKKSMSVSSKYNVTMILFNSDGSVKMDGVPVLNKFSIERTAADKAKLTFTPTLSGTLKYTLAASATVDPHDLKKSASFTANKSTTIQIDLSGWGEESPTISFLAQSGDFMGEIQSKKVPSFYDNELNYGGFFCGCKGSQFTVSGTFSSGEKLCVVSYGANGRMLGCHMMTAAGTVSLPEGTDHIELMSLDSAYLPKIARGTIDLSE